MHRGILISYLMNPADIASAISEMPMNSALMAEFLLFGGFRWVPITLTPPLPLGTG